MVAQCTTLSLWPAPSLISRLAPGDQHNPVASRGKRTATSSMGYLTLGLVGGADFIKA